jgi:hypothetical protein
VRMLACNGFGRVTTCRSSPFESTKRIMRTRSSSRRARRAERSELNRPVFDGDSGYWFPTARADAF